MASPDLSTIAQLLYPDRQTPDFARIVAELDAVLRSRRSGDVQITWDCDDIVTFDLAETRILLAWSETEKRGVGGCLTVSVGPNPLAMGRPSKSDHGILCSRLVERIQGRFDAPGVLWRQVAGPVGSDYVDSLTDNLPVVGGTYLPPIDSILETLSRADLRRAGVSAKPPHPRSVRAPELSRMAMEPASPSGRAANRIAVLGFGEAANDQPDLPLQQDAELTRLRCALYPVEKAADEVAYSTQMRLAAHCMNATLILVWAPLGAAVMTYSVLKGENMRMSARMMAVSGTLFAVAHSPVGQTVAAMAKGLT